MAEGAEAAGEAFQQPGGSSLLGGGTLNHDVTLDVGAAPDGSILVNPSSIEVGQLASDAQHGNRGNGALHTVVTGAANGFMIASDKTKLDGIASGATNTPLSNVAPVDVAKTTAAAGVATSAARQDHQHSISTAAPAVGAVTVGNSASEGTATSLARSDHVHAVASGTIGAVGTANSNGSAATFARSDHVHAGLIRGAADYTVFTHKATPVAADTMLIEDSANSQAKAYATLGEMIIAIDPFGRNYQTAIATARTTTSSNVFQTKVTLTTPALTGTYRVGWHALTDVPANNNEIQIQLLNVTDAVVVGAVQDHRPANFQEVRPASGFAEVVFTGALKAFSIQFRSVNGSALVGCQDARIEIWRVS